ncbi:MAG TPA: histidine kinase N-terminal domain-containing protein, partial [Acidimicrobiales bacterium]
MASLAELARQTTDLEPGEVAHLQRLVASWGLVADFCFADLLLLAPVRDTAHSRYVVLGQVR